MVVKNELIWPIGLLVSRGGKARISRRPKLFIGIELQGFMDKEKAIFVHEILGHFYLWQKKARIKKNIYMSVEKIKMGKRLAPIG